MDKKKKHNKKMDKIHQETIKTLNSISNTYCWAAQCNCDNCENKCKGDELRKTATRKEYKFSGKYPVRFLLSEKLIKEANDQAKIKGVKQGDIIEGWILSSQKRERQASSGVKASIACAVATAEYKNKKEGATK